MLVNFNLLPVSDDPRLQRGRRTSYQFITALPTCLIIAHEHALPRPSLIIDSWDALTLRQRSET